MNNLITEKSEYLLQHASNPVDWYPWCEEAFEKAKKEDKPIFLSIGYSSCHWCHVMEKESFEDLETARILNQNFVSIKVDREERPDIDSIYMASIQLITGSGGWPASIFLNNEKVPFFAGTYFPKFDHNNVPAFKSVLAKISELYQTQRDNVDEHSKVIFDGLKNFFENVTNNKIIINNLYEKIRNQINDSFDFEKGGFGDYPKFPETTKLEILYMLGKKYKSKELYDMGQLSLGCMINGGIFDQLSGGFARYSTDKNWRVPHFEKMLYDNSLLLNLLCNSYKITGNKNILTAILKTTNFLEFEMMSNVNLFYSTQDADTNDKEGEFYLWSYDELKNVFSKETFDVIKDYWNLNQEGDLDNKNILYVEKSIEEISKNKKKPAELINQQIETAKNKLIEIRNNRKKPKTDKKYITSWNALTISALCNSFNITNEEKYLLQASKTAQSILDNCYKDGVLNHTLESKMSFLEDYSYFTQSLFDLYNSTQSSEWYILADKFCNETIDKFWSNKENLFFDTFETSELIFRPKGFFDPMIPNSAAIATQNCYKLFRYSNNQEYIKIVGESLHTVSGLLDKSPLDLPSWFKLYYEMEEEKYEVFISGDRKDKFYNESINYLLSCYIPNTILVSRDLNNQSFKLPIMEGRLKDNKTKVYICKNNVCDFPIENYKDLKDRIKNIRGVYQ